MLPKLVAKQVSLALTLPTNQKLCTKLKCILLYWAIWERVVIEQQVFWENNLQTNCSLTCSCVFILIWDRRKNCIEKMTYFSFNKCEFWAVRFQMWYFYCTTSDLFVCIFVLCNRQYVIIVWCGLVVRNHRKCAGGTQERGRQENNGRQCYSCKTHTHIHTPFYVGTFHWCNGFYTSILYFLSHYPKPTPRTKLIKLFWIFKTLMGTRADHVNCIN